MIQFLGLLKNPLTKIIAEKTFGAIQHKLKKDQIIKQRELDHVQNVDVQSLKSSENMFTRRSNKWLRSSCPAVQKRPVSTLPSTSNVTREHQTTGRVAECQILHKSTLFWLDFVILFYIFQNFFSCIVKIIFSFDFTF